MDKHILVRDWEHFGELLLAGERDFFVGLVGGMSSSKEITDVRYSSKDGRLLGIEVFHSISSSWEYMTKKACMEYFPIGKAFYCRPEQRTMYRITGTGRGG